MVLIPRTTTLALALIAVTTLSNAASQENDIDNKNWTEPELSLILPLSLDNLGPRPPDPSNRYAEDPDAMALGESLFNDTRFSLFQDISCATCHRVDYHFTDPLPRSVGMSINQRRPMPIVGIAYQDWFTWDGREDSLWAQALEPLENPVEHGIARTRVAQIINEHYRSAYTNVFGELPDLDFQSLPPQARPTMEDDDANSLWSSLNEYEQEQITRIFVNTGKAIAAFVRRIVPTESDFDRFAYALFQGSEEIEASLTPEQQEGLSLFIGKGQRINCHNGPLFTNGVFHHTGAPDADGVDVGRSLALELLQDKEFGYFSRWSDADPETDGAHVRFMDQSTGKYRKHFKTPSLRNVAARPPYTHAGKLGSLGELLRRYRDLSGTEIADELFHGDLTGQELLAIEQFLHSLTAPATIDFPD